MRWTSSPTCVREFLRVEFDTQRLFDTCKAFSPRQRVQPEIDLEMHLRMNHFDVMVVLTARPLLVLQRNSSTRALPHRIETAFASCFFPLRCSVLRAGFYFEPLYLREWRCAVRAQHAGQNHARWYRAVPAKVLQLPNNPLTCITVEL